MTSHGCTGEPISWLRLERYRLGELSAGERDVIAAHIEACTVCAACLYESERSLALPPLSLGGQDSRLSHMRRLLAGPTPAGAFLRLAFAGVALLLLVRPIGKPTKDELPSHRTGLGSKGGNVALDLVRERNGMVEHDATTFAPDDRWKVLLTCPTERMMFWDLVVVDGGQASFPLSPQAAVACGNRVPLPGAFRLFGAGPVTVCLVLASEPVDRNGLGPLDVTSLSDRGACTQLRSAEPSD
jgi:hypothetical protein